MARKYFGTDGIRGRTNASAMTPEMAMKVGQAAGAHFLRGKHKHRVVIGKDTRLSGYMIENALVAGFTSVGMDVVQFGPIPTPAVALLTRSMRADLGVMISASHNPYEDNGIKLFGPDGFKLSDADEIAIEALLDQPSKLANAPDVGRARRIEDSRGRYIHAVKASVPEHIRFDGLHVVLDCAHGAAYQVAPTAIWELGAKVTPIGVTPNGKNINDKVGSTYVSTLQETVVSAGADIGIALDGDADRLIVVDEKGRVVDGDQIMALLGTAMSRAGRLTGDGIVATVMSNLGLERYLESQHLKLVRAKVGDRYVLEEMRNHGINVGGEQSGHMILLDHATTGDGTIAALQVLAQLVESGKPASEVLHLFDPVPQLLKNVRFSGGKPLDNPAVQAIIAQAEAELAGKGRLVIRPSGTEPVIRVMAEGDDAAQVEKLVDAICDAVKGRGSLNSDGKPVRVLIIAGSDSGGGAGIQADIKTVTMLGGHAMTSITAITAQNTLGVDAVHMVPTDMVIDQIASVVSDIGVDAVKIGMIGNASTAHAVADSLAELSCPIVFDPVMVATSGAVLADADTISAFERLMRLATITTPNLPELEALGGKNALLARHIPLLIKGGHSEDDLIVDELHLAEEQCVSWSDERIATRSTHGTGCTLATAIATGLGQGMDLVPAIERARLFVRLALHDAPGLGQGHGPMGHQSVREDAMVAGPSLNQVTVGCRDYGASVDFYRTLGLQQIVDSPSNGYARFEMPNGVTFSIHQNDACSTSTVVYFESKRLDAWVTELLSQGYMFDQMPQDESWGWREARLLDPAGNMVCLYSAGENRRYPAWRI